MKNSENKKFFQISLFIFIAVVILGIGYAVVTSIQLLVNGTTTISPDQKKFKVHFVSADKISGSSGVSVISSIDSNDDTKALFSITGLSKKGDNATAVYKVKNDSKKIGTKISLDLTNSNSNYFKVTETIMDNKLQAGETTTVLVKVEMIRTPSEGEVKTDISAKLKAEPIDNDKATGGEQKQIVNIE